MILSRILSLRKEKKTHNDLGFHLLNNHYFLYMFIKSESFPFQGDEYSLKWG